MLPPTSPALWRLIPICFSANQSWPAPCALTNSASTTQRPDDSIHYLPTADDRDDLFDWCFIRSVGINRYGELNEADVIESDAHWSVVKGEETGLPRPCVALRAACDREIPQHSPVETAGRPISLMRSDITLAAALSSSPPPLSAPLIRAEPANAPFPIPKWENANCSMPSLSSYPCMCTATHTHTLVYRWFGYTLSAPYHTFEV